ncbi:MAG: hypothetical protein ACLSB9_10570 [Hydrogeniiclostridium mannosilyticum]
MAFKISVIGFNDPFHPQSCDRYLRTGEQQFFAAQDPRRPWKATWT